jgi:hypothetical protein
VAQLSFNAGEFGPEVEARVDISKYAYACARMENFIPLVQGPARRRGGTKFVAEVKDSADRTWLAKFQFSSTQAYVLEFGDLYVRFYTDNGVVETAPDTPLEVSTPWPAADLIRADGTFALSMVQSGDVLYICHPDYAPRKLTRSGALSWALSTLSTEGGPFEDTDPDETVTVYSSAITGSVTLTASSSTFATTDIGRLFYLENKKINDIPSWEPEKPTSTNEFRRAGGRTYKATANKTTGLNRPIHHEGTENDGEDGVPWAFQDPGYGWCVITAYTSATEVTATVLSQLPDQVTLVANATTRWAFGAWGSVPGYPSHVAFFRNRLCFARAVDRKVWFSVVEDYENFKAKDAGGEVTAEQAIRITVDSEESNPIEWMVSADALLIGTSGEEFAIMENTDADPFGPGNVKAHQFAGYGSRGVNPVRVGSSALFVQRAGRKLREISPDQISEKFQALNMSVLAPHMVRKGTAIRQMAYQKEPHSIIWIARDDGQLRGFTFDREQYADPPYGGWHRHVLGGDGVVDSLVCVPSPNNDRDDLWMIVSRTIDGGTKRYVEYMMPEYEDGDDVESSFYVDCGLTYDDIDADVISGLDHLEGETVDVLINGAAHPQRTVFGGSITLTHEGSVVQIGLPCPAKLATMRLEVQTDRGTVQGKTKRIDRVTGRFLETLGGSMGPTESELDEILFRSGSDDMDEAPPLFTGDTQMVWRGGYELEGRIWFVADQPLPVTVLAFIPDFEVSPR